MKRLVIATLAVFALAGPGCQRARERAHDDRTVAAEKNIEAGAPVAPQPYAGKDGAYWVIARGPGTAEQKATELVTLQQRDGAPLRFARAADREELRAWQAVVQRGGALWWARELDWLDGKGSGPARAFVREECADLAVWRAALADRSARWARAGVTAARVAQVEGERAVIVELFAADAAALDAALAAPEAQAAARSAGVTAPPQVWIGLL